MSYFKILNNQRGALLLTFVVITAIGGTILAVLGPQLEPLREVIQAPTVKAIEASIDLTNDGPTSEEFQQARDLIVTVGELGLATGAVMNSIASLPSGGIDDLAGTAIATAVDIAQSDLVSRGSDPSPTTSNTLPPDVQAPGTCNNSNLSSCTSRSSCTSVGGYWHSNNTCSSSPVAVCDNDNLELCTSSNCSGAGGYWYNNYCNFIPEDTCDNDHLYLCESNTCGGAGGYWYNNRCNSTREVTCDSDNLNLCDSSDCSDAGGYWYDTTCNNTAEPTSTAGTVTSAGQVWMDRNLGASRVATSTTDELAYGDLYQWGRGADGHQSRTSPTTTTTSSTDTPGHGDFITNSSSPDDWRVPQNDNLWQGVNGTNNPCPAGFRLPTEIELATELVTWGSGDSEGDSDTAFASPLKFVVAHYRNINGTLTYAGLGGRGNYWSSTVNGSSARYLYFYNDRAAMSNNHRVHGFSARCLKD